MRLTGSDRVITPEFPDQELEGAIQETYPDSELLGILDGPDDTICLLLRDKTSITVVGAVKTWWGGWMVVQPVKFVAADGAEIPELLLWGH